MTNEAMLKLLKEAMDEMSKYDKSYNKLQKLEFALLENIREEIAKKSGCKKSDLSIIKNITKVGDKTQDERWNHYHSFTYNGIDYKGFLEGHYMLASQFDFGYEQVENPININSLIPDDAFNTLEIHIDINDLKLFTKTVKRSDYGSFKMGKPYIIENENIKIGFNPYYLLDALNFNETNIIYVKNHVSPAFMKNDTKKTLGFVLPVYLK